MGCDGPDGKVALELRSAGRTDPLIEAVFARDVAEVRRLGNPQGWATADSHVIRPVLGPALLSVVIDLGCPDLVAAALEPGGDPNALMWQEGEGGISLLAHAAWQHDIATMTVLFDHGASVAKARETTDPLSYAGCTAEPDTLTFLMDHGANPEFSVLAGQDTVAVSFFGCGLDNLGVVLDRLDALGKRPADLLLRAVPRRPNPGAVELIQFLVARGYDPKERVTLVTTTADGQQQTLQISPLEQAQQRGLSADMITALGG